MKQKIFLTKNNDLLNVMFRGTLCKQPQTAIKDYCFIPLTSLGTQLCLDTKGFLKKSTLNVRVDELSSQSKC